MTRAASPLGPLPRRRSQLVAPRTVFQDVASRTDPCGLRALSPFRPWERRQSLLLLILLQVVPLSCGPAPHVSDYRLAALHRHMRDADNLRATIPQTTYTAMHALCMQAIWMTRAHSISSTIRTGRLLAALCREVSMSKPAGCLRREQRDQKSRFCSKRRQVRRSTRLNHRVHSGSVRE